MTNSFTGSFVSRTALIGLLLFSVLTVPDASAKPKRADGGECDSVGTARKDGKDKDGATINCMWDTCTFTECSTGGDAISKCVKKTEYSNPRECKAASATGIIRGILQGKSSGAIAATGAIAVTGASAQENQITPPPPLSPPIASSDAVGQIDLQFLRNQIENIAQTQICAALAEPGEVISAADCRILMVNGDRGVKWRTDGRPTRCERDCLHAPRLAATEFRDAPNFRFAKISAHLGFDIDIPYWPDRSVRYPYDLSLRCDFDGAANGEIIISPQFKAPILNDPPLGEAIVDFFLLPANLSRFVEAKIKENLSTPVAGPAVFPSACASIGAVANDASSFGLDKVIWDLPEPRTIRDLTTVQRAGKTATVYFDRIERKSTQELTPFESATKFTVYINGAQAEFPSGNDFSLARGESKSLNYCKTVSLAGKDSLQIILADDAQGAVWSQFSAQQAFGAGAARKMTTGRDAWEPVRQPGDKPRMFSAREYELSYRIKVHDPNALAMSAAPRAGGGTAPGSSSGAIAGGSAIQAPAQRSAGAILGTSAPASGASCRKI